MLVGSVKSNIGHLEASAGVAGVIKVILSLRHRAIPASLHFSTPNPMIPWDRLPVRVPTALTPWAPAGSGRHAGVSSFGFSGTNAHVIVSEAPMGAPAPASAADRPAHLLALSAASETGLRALAARYADHLRAHRDVSIADVAHTANVGRARFRHRAAIVIGPGDDAVERIAAVAAAGETVGIASGQIRSSDGPRVVFLFSGQGSQYLGMGRALFDTQPTFRRVLTECDVLLRDELQPGVLDVLYPPAGGRSRLDETAYTQPALFAFEYALAMMWQGWGVRPAAVMGHSLGEFVATTIAGVLSLPDALRLVAIRGRLGQRLPTAGKMAAVMTDVARVRAMIGARGGRVSLAAVNAPESSVISGPPDAVDALLAAFASEGVEARVLPISNAFHSAAVEPMLAEFGAAASAVTFGAPRLPIYSNLFGRRATAAEMSTASYWTRHLREPVQFAAGFAAAVADGYTTFLEVGPHTTLVGLGRQCCPDLDGAWLPTLRRDYDDWSIVLGSLGELFVAGAPVDWAAFDADYARRRVVLPTYPFERQRYVVEGSTRRRGAAPGADPGHPLLGRRIASPFLTDTVFETELSLEAMPWLTDHRVLGAAVLPATAYLEAAWAAATLVHGDAVRAIEDIDICEALVTPEHSIRAMQLSLSAAEGDAARFRVMSAGGEDVGAGDVWRTHASGTVRLRGTPAPAPPADLDAIRRRCSREIPVPVLYDAVAQRGVTVGPSFRGLTALHQGPSESLGRLRATDETAVDLARYHMHPALLDAALHAVAAAMFDAADLARPGESLMPIALEHFRLIGPPAADLWTHVVVRPAAPTASPVVDVRVYDETGTAVAEVVGLQFRRVSAAAWAHPGGARVDEDLYDVTWRRAAALPAADAHAWTPPAPSEIVASAGATPALSDRLRAYSRRLPELDALARDFIVNALVNLGWAPSPGTRVHADALAETLGVAPQHRRLLDRLLAILAEDGVLARDGDHWIAHRELACVGAARRLDALRATFVDGAGELGLLAQTGPELAACLAGRVDPLSLLFADGRFDAANDLYRKSPPAVVLNALAREAVARFVAAAPAGAPLRVLEIGAGTGGTTSSVLPVCPADRTTYVFSDLSPLFLARAGMQFADYPFVDYRLLDIERDPSTQGFAGERFDLVIAANVLHATRDLAETLAHVRQLVRPGGVVLLLEGTRPQRWIDLTFGLTDGWWRFTDRGLRPDYPLLDRAPWCAVLAAAGFEAPAVAAPGPAGDPLGDNILLGARVPAECGGRWIVFTDAAGVGGALARDLRGAGHPVLTVTPGATLRRSGDEATLPPADAEAYRRLIDDVTRDQTAGLEGVAHLWSLDATPDDDAPIAQLRAAEDLGCRSVLHLTQALGTSAGTGTRLAVVTRNTQAVADGDVPSPVHASIWGLAGTIRLEHPDLDCLCLDLDGAPGDAGDLAARVVARGEPQLAERGGRWFAARLVRHAPAPRAHGDPDLPVGLVNRTPGRLDGLSFVPAPRAVPGPREVEIRVTVSAMNFRDVLIAMGLYPGVTAADRLGGECAGVVLAVGADVRGVAIGDAVMAMATGGHGSHVIAHADHVAPLPRGLSAEQAVTLPSAFVTAWHALYDLAGLRAGETVLVHAGAGGVGLAAIQLARRVGARVFATAGSPEKRAYLTSLGVEHVMDSRTVAYAEDLVARTNGAGVDVVLNSLAAPHVDRSFSVLAATGRFVELGKRDIWSAPQARDARPHARYFVVDLAAVGAADPAVVGALLRHVRRAADDGEIAPLPVTPFDASEVGAAFRFMAQAKHIGKIVIRRPPVRDAGVVRADGAYLVTGGTGGLGMVVAGRLVERGAGHVVLMSRRPADAAAQAVIDGWNRDRPRVSTVAGDVGREDAVRAALARVTATGLPLRGVVHSAGTLHDGVLAGRTWADFAETFGPKVDGSWHLHRLTRALPLDFFVLFSSISALLGSAGQGNHAAANAFMDSLAHRRRACGLAALSINWGAWDDVGAAVARNVAGRIAAQGMGTIAPARGIAALERLLAGDAARAAVMPVDWADFASRFAAGRLRETYLAELAAPAPARTAGRAEPARSAASRPDATPLRDAPVSTRWDLLQQRIRSLAARVLGLDASTPLNPTRPLQEMGLDSLMAVELRNLLKSECGLDRAPAATVVFDHPTVHALAEFVGTSLYGWPPRDASPAPSAPAPFADAAGLDLLDQLEGLSPEDTASRLSNRLAGGGSSLR